MNPLAVSYLWRLGLLAVLLIAIVLGYLRWQHLVTENAELTAAAQANTEAIRTLTTRIRATEAAQAALTTDAAATRSQVARGISQLDKARRNDPETQKVDRPWPAAVRFRVFDDPDPTTGSTARAGVADPGTGGVGASKPRRPDAGSDSDAAGHR